MNVLVEESGKKQEIVDQNQTIDIDAVEIGEIDAGGILYDDTKDKVRFDSIEHHDKTASKLAIIILCILTGSFVIHYTVSAILVSYSLQSTADHLGKLFEIWLPLISGFTGSTVTYYFTREKR